LVAGKWTCAIAIKKGIRTFEHLHLRRILWLTKPVTAKAAIVTAGVPAAVTAAIARATFSAATRPRVNKWVN
jgi:hypothetical protein